jgi:hypothetical protein
VIVIAVAASGGGSSSPSLSDSSECIQWIDASYGAQVAYAATRQDLGDDPLSVISTECGGAVAEPDPSAPDYVGPQSLGDVACGEYGVNEDCSQ